MAPVVRPDRDGLEVVLRRLFAPAHRLEHLSHQLVRRVAVGLQRQRLVQVVQGFLAPPRAVVDPRQRNPDLRLPLIERQRLVGGVDRLGRPFRLAGPLVCLPIRLAEPRPREREAGIALDRAPQQRCRPLQAARDIRPLEELHRPAVICERLDVVGARVSTAALGGGRRREGQRTADRIGDPLLEREDVFLRRRERLAPDDQARIAA